MVTHTGILSDPSLPQCLLQFYELTHIVNLILYSTPIDSVLLVKPIKTPKGKCHYCNYFANVETSGKDNQVIEPEFKLKYPCKW